MSDSTKPGGTSEARILANRRNARKSTGPRTAEGKERSRANALKHGLCSSTLVPEDAPTVQARAEQCYHALKPRNLFQSWLCDGIAVMTLRIDRCERIERRLRDKLALRAGAAWDLDRKSEAEALGAGLAISPAGVVDALKKTPHGCDWLIARWALLARAGDRQGSWTEGQVRLAFDLLGTPADLRVGPPGEVIDELGRLVGPPLRPEEVARREIASLQATRDELADFDEVDRALAEGDLAEPTLELRRLRRHEATLHHRLRWYMDQLQQEPPDRRPNPETRPRFTPEPKIPPPTPAPGPAAPETPAPTAAPVVEFWAAQPPHPAFDVEVPSASRTLRPARAPSKTRARLRPGTNPTTPA